MTGAGRVVVVLVDGFGLDYWDGTPLPGLKRMAAEGVFRRGRAIFPALTNANNVSLATGAWPAEHGVTTNCYFDEATGEARFLEDPTFILAPTLFQRARKGCGRRSSPARSRPCCSSATEPTWPSPPRSRRRRCGRASALRRRCTAPR